MDKFSMLDKESLYILGDALDKLGSSYSGLPPLETNLPNIEEITHIILEVAGRLQDNYPYFHPLYAGQMLKPPHPIARLAYMLAMWINPNNHALDGGRASSQMEKESVANIARMIGWDIHLGHLCSGGTIANLEALWVASKIHPNKKIVASQQAHYTHSRISGVLGLQFEAIPCDSAGRIDINKLQRCLDRGNVGTVVATIGTTAIGSVDSLQNILNLKKQYGFRLHADAAYGGYFCLIDNLMVETRHAYDRLGDVDSIVIDPHKHGLQPYGCGCVLFRDPSVGQYYKHDSPYTYFSSSDLHLGEISLECSRPGAAAVGLWATQRLLPLIPGGEFSQGLKNSRQAALILFEKLKSDQRFITSSPPELDIVVWLPKASSTTSASKLSKLIFDEAAKRNLHLALAELPIEIFDLYKFNMDVDSPTVTCLRSVLMKTDHYDWIENIWDILDKAANAVFQLRNI